MPAVIHVLGSGYQRHSYYNRVQWTKAFLFFKQKTSYEVLISDWSSDVCSSDLGIGVTRTARLDTELDRAGQAVDRRLIDRKSVVEGKSVSVRVDLGARRNIINK